MEISTVMPEILPSTGPMGVEHEMLSRMGMKSVPYKIELSFRPLIKFIESKLEGKNLSESFLAEKVLEHIRQYPEFLEGGLTCEGMEKYKGLIEMLSMFVLPPALEARHLVKFSPPFDMTSFYITPALEKQMAGKHVELVLIDSEDKLDCGLIIRACSLILNRIYNQDLAIDSPVNLSAKDPQTGMVKFFKLEMNFDFVEVRPLKPVKKLTEDQIHEMLRNIFDLDLWFRYLPPDAFEFEGFIMASLIDITAEDALSRLKFSLLEPMAVMDQAHITRLETIMRQYFRIQDMRLGLTALDYPKANTIDHAYRIRFDFLSKEIKCLIDPDYNNSIYDKACKYREILLVEDLMSLTSKTKIEKKLLAQGIRSYLVAPLISADKIIGLLEIGSPTPYALNSFVEAKFKELVGLFTMALSRSRDEIDNRVEAIMRDQFTALHPSVTWRFTQAAFNLLEKRETNPRAQVEEIVFEEVYPLYGQADIVGSSTKRNQAILNDLLFNLKLAFQTLKTITGTIRFPYLDQLNSIINQEIAGLETEFSSSDETRVVEFIQQDVHPVFTQVLEDYPRLKGVVDKYFSQIDTDLGIVYRERKKFEDSVAQVNQAIGDYLEHAQEEMQATLPHYFEKYKTDGVEYDLYIGQSLMKAGKFSPIHLKNFRLWQLIHMCEMTKLIHDLGPGLPMPLTTAQLVFAYTSPLSIRFRQEEKQFDVDGAYNVRYEILKKRIDKATIEGTNERLTQAGKIAIVYLHDKDRHEYLGYLHYLLEKGMITDNIEDLHLSRLQGVQGLKALRVEVAG
ncbi:MAG: GAF domain-containing protein [Lewinella sp.]|nr:GAF domain-containing protein [Lewinella sp.]